MFKEELKYINDRLEDLGFFEYEESGEIRYMLLDNNMYIIRIFKINDNNLRCELIKRGIVGGLVFAGVVMTSCVISNWHGRLRKARIDDWVDNFLLIPEIKLVLRGRKIKKINEKRL